MCVCVAVCMCVREREARGGGGGEGGGYVAIELLAPREEATSRQALELLARLCRQPCEELLP